MLRILCVLIACCSLYVLEAQKLSDPYQLSANQPKWVQLMYQPEAMLQEVQAAFDIYYQQHPFIKNQHTQFFKRWKRHYARFPAFAFMNDNEKLVFNQHKDQYKLKSRQLAQQKNASALWTPIGPYNFDKTAASTSYACGAAHIYTLKQAQSNSDVLYAGTATAGVWKSTNKGQHWTACTSSEWITTVKALAIDPSNSSIVYAASDLDNKLYKTSDAGASWQIIGDTAFNTKTHFIKDIVVHPQSNNIVLLASSEGLYRTIDSGQSFQLIDPDAFQEIEFHPHLSNTIYAVKQIGQRTEFYKSVDDGQSFTHKPNGWPVPNPIYDDQMRTEIAVSPADSNRVYALLSGAAGLLSGLYGIFISYDAGETWTSSCCGAIMPNYPSVSNPNLLHWYDDGTGNGGQYYYDLALAVSPTNVDSVLVGGVNLWVSSDGAASFNCPAQWNHSYKNNYVHADIHDIHFVDNRIWIASDGGIFYSADNGSSFQVRMNGILGTDFWGFGAGFQHPDVMLGGTFHNGTLLKDKQVYQNEWLSTDGGDNYRGFVHPFFNNKVVSDFGGKQLSGDRTIAHTITPFLHLPHAGITTGFSGNLVYHPRFYNTLYSTDYYNLWKSDNNGISWSLVHSFGAGLLTSLRISSVNPNILFLNYHPDGNTDDRKILRSADGGYHWTDVSPDNNLINQNRWVSYDIALSALDSNLLWASRISKYEGWPNLNGQQVYESQDGGQSWQNITASGLDGVFSTNLLHLQGSNKGLYLGTRNAVYYKNDTMSQWQLVNNGLPLRTHSVQLAANYRDAMLRNASNRSVYECPFYETIKPIAQIAVDKQTTNCPSDSFYFASLSYTNASASYLWEFEQGQPAQSNDQNPVVLFPNSGVFSVRLTVTDSNGVDSLLLTNFIEVNNDCRMDTVAGFALQLSTNNDYLQTSPLNYNGNQFSITAWIKPDTIQAQYTGIVTHANSAQPAGIMLNNNNELMFQWQGAQWSWHSGLFVPVDSWSHVALVIKPDRALVYLNGDSSVYNSTMFPMQWSDALVIGRYANWNSRNYTGQIEEVCIWDTSLTQVQIRAQMHLTKYEQQASSLLHYYQFNALGPKVLDRKANLHAEFRGGASRILSTAPVGGGVSQTIDVDSAGGYHFEEAFAKLYFNDSLIPNGPIVVNRLNVSPDIIPNNYLYTGGYWILNNYGEHRGVLDLDSLVLESPMPIHQSNSNSVFLKHRYVRGASNSWQISYDSLKSSSAYHFSFEAPWSTTNFGQLALLSDSMPLVLYNSHLKPLIPKEYTLFPNPSYARQTIFIKLSTADSYRFELFNVKGQKIEGFSFEGNQVRFELPVNQTGYFFYRLVSDQKVFQGALHRLAR